MGGGPNQDMSERNLYINRNSIIAQMNDITGKSKSQQVIVLENMVTKLETILESFRSREKTMAKLSDMMEELIERESIVDDELDEIMEVVKARFQEEVVELEKAVSTVAAMPALIEGDTGVIEGMIQPSATLMRRQDGSTMRDSVYGQMFVDRQRGVAQMRNPPHSIVGDETNPVINTNHPVMGMTNNFDTRRDSQATAATSTTADNSWGWEIVIKMLDNYGTDKMIDMMECKLDTEGDAPLPGRWERSWHPSSRPT